MLWVTWTLSNLDFGQLGHWIAWVTWTLDNLGNLDFGQFANSNYWEFYVLKNFTRVLMAENISGLLVQWTLDLRKISTCKFTYILKTFFSDDRFLDSVHKSFLNQTTLDLRKEKMTFLYREFTVIAKVVTLKWINLNFIWLQF